MGLPYASNLQHSDHVHQQQQQQQHSKYTSEDESSSVTGSGSNVGPNLQNYSANITYQINSGESSTSPSKRTYHKTNTLNSNQNSIISQSAVPATSILNTANPLFDPNQFVKKDEFEELSNQLKAKKEEHDKLSKELDKLKDQYQNELSNFHQSLTEERDRHDVGAFFLFDLHFKNYLFLKKKKKCHFFLVLFTLIVLFVQINIEFVCLVAHQYESHQTTFPFDFFTIPVYLVVDTQRV